MSALEIKRHCQINYQSALFLLNRVRWAIAPNHKTAPKLCGIIEADETYVGGKPKVMRGLVKRAWQSNKTPVFAVVERGGDVRVRVMPTVTAANVKDAMRECVDFGSHLMTDENKIYRTVGPEFLSHQAVNHSLDEFARGDVTTNTAEGFFSILKRGINGVYHSVSKQHLHRYLAEFEFRYNTRKMNDGDRTVKAIQAAEGKRLRYRQPVAPPAPAPGEQFPPF